MQKTNLPGFSQEEEEMFLRALEHPGTSVDAGGTGLRGPDPKDPSYKKWKEQNGKSSPVLLHIQSLKQAGTRLGVPAVILTLMEIPAVRWRRKTAR